MKTLFATYSKNYEGHLIIWKGDTGKYYLDLETKSIGKTLGVFDTLAQAVAGLEAENK